MRFLIVEDDNTARKLLEIYLSDFGSCDFAENGIEAVEQVRQSLIDRRKRVYDMICLDLMMPQFDGHNALQTIRQLEEKHGVVGNERSKVVITTALNRREEISRSFSEGCESYLVKPIGRDRLLDEMKRLGLIECEAEEKQVRASRF